MVFCYKMNSMDFKLYSELTTERLVLRKLETIDSNLIFTLRSSKEVTKYIARPLCSDLEEAKIFIKDRIDDIDNNISIVWTIRLKDSLIPTGTICLWNFSKDKKTAEVGYDMLPEFQNNGYMIEALKRVLIFGFKELNLNTIEAYTSKHNKRSISLLEKNHFILQKERKDKGFPDNIIFTRARIKK